MFQQYIVWNVHSNNDSPKEGTKGWKKELNKEEHIFVVIKKNGEDAFDNDASSLNSNDIKNSKKEARGAAKKLKRILGNSNWRVPQVSKPDFISTPGRQILKFR